MPFEPAVPLPPLVLPVGIDATGATGPTRGRAQGPGWRRVGPNAYVPVVAEHVSEQRIADATAFVPASGAITGWAALRVHGAAYFDGTIDGAVNGATVPVDIATGSRAGRRRRPGLHWTYEPLRPDEIEVKHGIRVTRPDRALFDAMRRETSWRRAVVAANMAVAANALSVDALRTFAETRARWRRAERVLEPLPWVREGFRSPREVLLHLIWRHDAGLPDPLVNVPLFDLDGQFVACPDILDTDAGMVVEYDGTEHRKVKRHAHDVEREDACRRIGLEYAKVVGPDMDDVGKIVDRLHTTRRRAAFLPPGCRQWTTEWPRGWRPWW